MPAQIATSKRRIFKKRSYKSKAPSKTVQRYVGKAIRSYERKNIEHKYHAYGFLASSTTNLGIMYDLTQISQGLQDTARVGDQIKLSSFRANVLCRAVSTAGQCVRFIFFQYGDEATPTATDILQNDGAGYTHMSMLNHDSLRQGKLIPILDRLVVLDQDDPVSKVDFNFLLKRRKVNFVNGTNNGNNKLYMYVCTDQVSSTPTIEIYGKLNFTDP